ncbi:MAG: hypothetical protein R3C59_27405 [Planctomycetaceae bacterium]
MSTQFILDRNYIASCVLPSLLFPQITQPESDLAIKLAFQIADAFLRQADETAPKLDSYATGGLEHLQ